MEHEEGGGGHDSSERWLVSYADFITLLFALFVLMYAMSMQSTDQVNRAWTALATGVGVRPHRGGMRPELGETARGGSVMTELSRKALSDLRDSMSNSVRAFQNSGVSLRLDSRGLVISLSAARFFASGDAEINPQQLPVLAAVTKELSGRANPMEIDGFTDPIPIHDSRFHDNWELSAARAATVLRYLIAHTWLHAEQLSLAGYGPYHPVADNGTEEGRSLNRRVDIVVRPLEAQQHE
jgi:chemotaxis protein MotB